MSEICVGVLTCSDSRAVSGADDDAGRALMERAEALGWSVVAYHVCPDDRECIAASLMEMTDVEQADVVFTCGGTGLGPRDVTPEATVDVAERMVPGIAEHIRAVWARTESRAMLSRGVAAQRGTTLLINLPGTPEATVRAFEAIAEEIEHAADVAAGRRSY